MLSLEKTERAASRRPLASLLQPTAPWCFVRTYCSLCLEPSSPKHPHSLLSSQSLLSGHLLSEALSSVDFTFPPWVKIGAISASGSPGDPCQVSKSPRKMSLPWSGVGVAAGNCFPRGTDSGVNWKRSNLTTRGSRWEYRLQRDGINQDMIGAAKEEVSPANLKSNSV